MRLPSIDSEVASFAAKRTRANFRQLFPARVFPIVNRVVSRVAPRLAGCFVGVTVFPPFVVLLFRRGLTRLACDRYRCCDSYATFDFQPRERNTHTHAHTHTERERERESVARRSMSEKTRAREDKGTIEEEEDDACFTERVKRWIRGGYRGWQRMDMDTQGRQRVVDR